MLAEMQKQILRCAQDDRIYSVCSTVLIRIGTIFGNRTIFYFCHSEGASASEEFAFFVQFISIVKSRSFAELTVSLAKGSG